MKLLIVTDNFLPRLDGISRFLEQLLPRIRDRYQVTVVAPAFPGATPSMRDVNIVRLPVHRFKVGDYQPAKFSRKIRRYVKDADVVFTQTIGPLGMSGVRWAKKYKKPNIAYIHSVEWELVANSISHLKPFFKWVVRRVARNIYKDSSLLLVPSIEISTILQQNKIYTPKKIVHLGVDTAKFVPPKRKVVAKANIGIDPKVTVIGFCGRLGREKDLPTLFAAFERLHRRYSNVCLAIVAGGIEDYRREFEKNPDIFWFGTVRNVVPYLQAMDIFVLPSLTETSSLATMEAMSSELAVVCTPVGSIREYVRNGYNGILFSRGDVRTLERKLEKLVRSEELRKKLGRNARVTMKDYSWDRAAKDICGVIDSLQKKQS